MSRNKALPGANTRVRFTSGLTATSLTKETEISNTAKSRVRARVEHVFGYQTNSMGGIFLCSIGAARAAVGVGLMNLTYNLARIEVLIRLKVFDFDRIAAPKIQGAA